MIGQEKILREINLLIPELQAGKNMNILFLGPSGHGKTHLAWYILYHVNYTDCWFYVPEKGEIDFQENKIYHFIDEIHTLDDPEFLYPLMDSGNYTFIFCTNEFGNLPEPFMRRCITFNLKPYTDDEIYTITQEFFTKLGFELPENIVRVISSVCKRNPGVSKTLTTRLSYIFKNHKIPKSEEEINEILNDILDIQNGLTEVDRRYLDSLKLLKVAGIKRISLHSRIPENIILRDIEPFLLEKNIISIGSKGRFLL